MYIFRTMISNVYVDCLYLFIVYYNKRIE